MGPKGWDFPGAGPHPLRAEALGQKCPTPMGQPWGLGRGWAQWGLSLALPAWQQCPPGVSVPCLLGSLCFSWGPFSFLLHLSVPLQPPSKHQPSHSIPRTQGHGSGGPAWVSLPGGLGALALGGGARSPADPKCRQGGWWGAWGGGAGRLCPSPLGLQQEQEAPTPCLPREPACGQHLCPFWGPLFWPGTD